MIVDSRKYRANFEYIKMLLARKLDSTERLEEITIISVALGVPLLVCLSYCGEIYGFTEDITSKMERVKIYYGVVEVI